MSRLFEQYRPAGWNDVVGQGKAVAILRGMLQRDAGGSAVLLEGDPGTGKTSIAMILAREFTGGGSGSILRMDGKGTSAAGIRTMAEDWRYRSLFGKRAVVIDEIQDVTGGAEEALLTVLERIPEDTIVIGTTTASPVTSWISSITTARLPNRER